MLLSDPLDLLFPPSKALPIQDTNPTIRDLQIRKLEHTLGPRDNHDMQLDDDIKRLRFYEIEVLLADLSLLSSSIYAENRKSRPRFPLGALHPQKTNKKRKESINSFIVPDGMSATGNDHASSSILEPENGVDPYFEARLKAVDSPTVRSAIDMGPIYISLFSDTFDIAVELAVDYVQGFAKDDSTEHDHIATL